HGMGAVVELSADGRAEARPAQRQRPSVDSETTAASKAGPKRTASGARRGQRPGGKASAGQSASAVSKGSAVAREQAQARIVDTLKDAGGKLDGASVRALAKGTGAKRSTVHNALASLIGAGIVAKVGAGLVLTAG